MQRSLNSSRPTNLNGGSGSVISRLIISTINGSRSLYRTCSNLPETNAAWVTDAPPPKRSSSRRPRGNIDTMFSAVAFLLPMYGSPNVFFMVILLFLFLLLLSLLPLFLLRQYRRPPNALRVLPFPPCL